MLEYAPMLHVSYYAQNYAGIVRQGLVYSKQFVCALLGQCTTKKLCALIRIVSYEIMLTCSRVLVILGVASSLKCLVLYLWWKRGQQPHFQAPPRHIKMAGMEWKKIATADC